MIQVVIKTNTLRQTVNAETTNTPASLFQNLGIDVSGSVVNVNGSILTTTELNSAFSTLGVTDGQTVNLNSIIKANGANND